MAHDAVAAVQLALAHEPDLLLLDVVMPGGGGYAICEALRAQAPERDLVVIFLTALTRPEELQDGFAAGAVDYITKPFNTALLRSRVYTWLLRLAEQRASAEPQPRQGRTPPHGRGAPPPPPLPAAHLLRQVV